VISCFPVCENDQIMLLTNKGTIIRCPVKDIRIAGRSTQGVVLFRVASDEIVVSAARIPDAGNGDEGDADEETTETEDNATE
jgi:DNA gyrase subunit A